MIKYWLAIKSYNLLKVRCEVRGYLQFFTPGTFRSSVLSGSGERGKVDSRADIWSCLHPGSHKIRAGYLLALISPSRWFPGFHCAGRSSTFSTSHLRWNIGSANNIRLLHHYRSSPGQWLALHHGGLRLAGVAPLPVLLVPGAGLLLLLNYFSVLINLPFMLSQSIKN